MNIFICLALVENFCITVRVVLLYATGDEEV